MFFLELCTDDARKAVVHFAVGVDIADVVGSCKVAADSYNTNVTYGGVSGDDQLSRLFLGPFTHYYEAAYNAEEQSRTVDKCPECFKTVQKKSGELMVNVVVFVWGCVEPDILVTFDDELAKQTYLKHEVALREEDFLVWEEVPIRSLLEPTGFTEPVDMSEHIKLGDAFEWQGLPYKVIAKTGDPVHTVTVLKQSGVTGEQPVDLTTMQYLGILLKTMWKEQEKDAVLRGDG